MDLFKRRTRNFRRFLSFLLAATPLFAQEKPPDAEDKPAAAENADALRKAAQNPVASLISVRVQNNNNFNISPGDRTQDVLNIQPVIPVRLTDSPAHAYATQPFCSAPFELRFAQRSREPQALRRREKKR